jgi:pSer/pThr/pTyr-binding forkhead associated (FHA) protein
VSRLHAELVQMGADWVVCDDGLSHNGTFVNGERVRGRRRLGAGDIGKVGATLSALFELFGLTALPQNAKRAALAARASVIVARGPSGNRSASACCCRAR